MTKTTTMSALALSFAVALAACKKDEPAATAAPVEQAAPAAAPAAKPAAPPVAPAAKQPASPGEALGQAVGALAKLAKAADQAQGGNLQGKVVNWRALVPFVPEKLGELVPEGELDGSTGGMGAMQLSRVKRRYKAGEQQGMVEIADATLVPMMRAGFAMAAAVNEDSTTGIKKGVSAEGNPGMLEWTKASQRGKITVLAGGRYIVSIEISPVPSADAVLALLKAVDLKKLAALKAE